MKNILAVADALPGAQWGIIRCLRLIPTIVQKLGLKQHVIEGATVCYEPCFEDKLDTFEKAYSDYRKQISERPVPSEKNNDHIHRPEKPKFLTTFAVSSEATMH